MRDIVDFLCSPECLPRTPGRDGGVVARRYLVEQLAGLDIEPLGEEGFEQPIPPIGGANVIARIAGNGPMAKRHIVVGAHYDACDTVGRGLPGAADNAASVAITLEVSKRLIATRGSLRRSVLVCLFDAEEPPYFMTDEMGSQWFVDHPTVKLDSIDLMICLDLVGVPLGDPITTQKEITDTVFVFGAELSEGTGRLLDTLPDIDGARPCRLDTYLREPSSDYHAFHSAGIPFLFYSVGRNRHYHRDTDTPDTLDFAKMAALTDHVEAAVKAVSLRPDGSGRFDPEGSDVEATLGTFRQVVLPLARDLDLPPRLVDAAEGLMSAQPHGALTVGQRRLAARLLDEVDQHLSRPPAIR